MFAKGVPRLMEFISAAFNGEVISRKERSDDSIMHAEMRIGDSMLMMGEATDEFGPDAVSNAIGYAKFYSRSNDAVNRVYDAAGNAVETHEQAGEFKAR